MNVNYENFISLGYYCDVAKDLEELGLRSASAPFDWVISDLRGVILAIDNNFNDFMNLELLSQSINDRSHYFDPVYNVFFFHDFSKYKSLEAQYVYVKEKYERRIKRFYEKIQTPTLFIRYISNEVKENDKSIELSWIEENYDHILRVLRKYNANNDIVFIGDENTPPVPSRSIK